MKMLFLTKSLAVSLTAAAFIGVGLQPSQAQRTGRFACEFNPANGLPTTYFYSPKGGRLPVVNWFSEYFSGSGYTPETRCHMVTLKFQKAYDYNSLGFVTTGVVRGLPVVCATAVRGGCPEGNVLFTLKPGANVPETVQKLFDIGSGRAKGRTPEQMALWESSADDDSITINMTQFLETAPAESATPESNAPSATPGMPTTPESNGPSSW